MIFNRAGMARKGIGQRNRERPSGVSDPVRKKLPQFKERFKTRPSAVVQALAWNIRRLRKKRSWSQEELAGECGLEQQVVSLLENGRANPTLMLVESLALAFGVPFVELFEARPRLRRSNSPGEMMRPSQCLSDNAQRCADQRAPRPILSRSSLRSASRP